MKSDAALKQDVEQELYWDPSLDARQIDVSVRDRIVTLRGFVPSWAQKYAAQKAAQRVAGARALVLELKVLPSEAPRDDEVLAAAIVSALAWQEALAGQEIHVDVDEGCVTLTGEVAFGYQRQAAETVVSRMRGVIGVVNRIDVRSRDAGATVRERVADALARRAQREAAHIEVDERDGIVTLTGTVDSLIERRAACGAAWSVKGVHEVIDHLSVA
ncbi:putative phospholipid-binding protein [Burkholderia pseudomallei]|uniref:BON domain-containing protein n=1 Tax=Burkholderia pseudomallei (strain K96243) TaxID=272560 RepID=Q63IV8_BURPS|nr:BON domain-containing protein [Burkholderia pseudomallei]AIP06302.1 BON domain protein [Burkholderia pseudomallei]AJX26610.1 BON domain protein [Burkholderia pseudomallei K96243]EIF71874.1 OsmY domain-containing protein [Burkholderia pseudomallei 354e]EIF74513.1 OsmY domain-containing protein [Burkholderia pseudomallei 354a]KAA8766471.1 BON domain-containing protein [Burkholderia pseudomallei]